MTSATASTIYPLANPKGVFFLCELCRKPATIICTKCRVTYYCNELHQDIDWNGVHDRICQLLIPLRSKNLPPIPFMPVLEEVQYRRELKQKQQKELLAITTNVAHRLMFEGKSDSAMPAALQSLNLTIDLYGVSSVQLVAPYLILAEAALGLGKADQAEGYLSQAEWTILKAPECPTALRHKLHRISGLLYFTKGDYPRARRCLAEDIYYASKEFGTNSIHTSGGYYQLARCFQKESKIEVADALFAKVIDLWCTFLTQMMREKIYGPAVSHALPYLETRAAEVPKFCLNEAQIAEAILVLNTIYELRAMLRETHALPKIAHCLAMLHFLADQNKKAIEYGRMVFIGLQGDTLQAFVKDAEEFLREYTHIRRQSQSKAMENEEFARDSRNQVP